MEYQFRYDPLSGNSTAVFSFEHEIIGPWLEVEIANNPKKLAKVLMALDDVVHERENEILIAGREYSLLIDAQDVQIKANSSFADNQLTEDLSAENLDYADTTVALCGHEDFREMLLSWARFVKNY